MFVVYATLGFIYPAHNVDNVQVFVQNALQALNALNSKRRKEEQLLIMGLSWPCVTLAAKHAHQLILAVV